MRNSIRFQYLGGRNNQINLKNIQCLAMASFFENDGNNQSIKSPST